VRLGLDLSATYVDQRRASLDLDRTPWQTLCPDGGDQVLVQGRFRHVVGYLRDFLFRPEQARTPIRALSGGERNRLLLATQLARPCNLMVLDEPTNDLDMDTLDLLQEILAEFAGTLLVVSHDRDFLDRLVTSVIAFEGGGRTQEYAGGYRDYLRQRRPVQEPVATLRPADRPKAGPGPLRLASRRQRELDRVIAEIEALETRVADLERELADADLFARDPGAFERRTERLAELRGALEAAERRWSALEAQLAEAGT
jgi:ATP-binding cassette subfamily F protein uup